MEVETEGLEGGNLDCLTGAAVVAATESKGSTEATGAEGAACGGGANLEAPGNLDTSFGVIVDPF